MTDPPKHGLTSIAALGLGSLSYGELAGERTKLGLMLHDPEEEDCFTTPTTRTTTTRKLGTIAGLDGAVPGAEPLRPGARRGPGARRRDARQARCDPGGHAEDQAQPLTAGWLTTR